MRFGNIVINLNNMTEKQMRRESIKKALFSKEFKSGREIAKKFNVSTALVSLISIEIGASNRISRVKKLHSEMERLFLEGYNITDIGKKLGIWYHTVGKYIESKGYKYSYYGKKDINSNIFNIIDNEEKAYWLGFLYADGSVNYNNNGVELSLQEKDLSHLQKFKDFLKWKGEIKYRKQAKAYRIMFDDTQIHDDLVKLGCIPRKSLILKFPTETQVPSHLVHHFIRGYFDGDGHIHNPENKAIGIQVLGTENFLLKLKSIYSHHKNAITHDSRHNAKVFRFSLFGKNARNFLNSLYIDATMYLNRKRERYNKYQLKYDKSK